MNANLGNKTDLLMHVFTINLLLQITFIFDSSCYFNSDVFLHLLFDSLCVLHNEERPL